MISKSKINQFQSGKREKMKNEPGIKKLYGKESQEKNVKYDEMR